jgi:hypothetical protein
MNDEATLKGILTDIDTNEPIRGALIRQNETMIAGHLTDIEGRFKLRLYSEGKRSISVRKAGYKTQNFNCYKNGKLQEFKLKYEGIQGEKINSSSESDSLNSKENEKTNIVNEDLSEVPNETKPIPVNPDTSRNKKDWSNIILYLIIILVVVISIYVFYKLFKSNSPITPGIPMNTGTNTDLTLNKVSVSQPPTLETLKGPIPQVFQGPSLKTPRIINV